MEILDQLAEELYGEFGLATCTADEQENIVEIYNMVWKRYIFDHMSITELSELFGIKKSILKKIGLK